MTNETKSLIAARFRVVFTPVGWQVIDTAEARDPIAEFGTGSDDYSRAKSTAERLNDPDLRCERCGTFALFGACGMRQRDCQIIREVDRGA